MPTKAKAPRGNKRKQNKKKMLPNRVVFNKSNPKLLTKFKKMRLGQNIRNTNVKIQRASTGALIKQLPHQIAYLVMNPSEAINLRWIDPLTSAEQPSAVAQQHVYQEFIQSTCVDQTELPLGTSMVAIFRDCLRAMVVWTPNPTPTAPSYYAYQANFSVTSMTWTTSSWNATGNKSETPVDVLYWTYVPTSQTFPLVSGSSIVPTVASWAPHGQFLYPGSKTLPSPSAGVSYVFLDKGDTLITSCTFAGSTDAGVQIKMYRYSGPQTVDSLEMTFELSTGISSGSQVYNFHPVSSTGYYCLTINDTTAGSSDFLSLAVYVYGNGDCFTHSALPSVATDPKFFNNARINAASLLITNTASDLNASGRVTGANFANGSEQWCDHLTADQIKATSTLPSCQTTVQAFKTGLYTYIRPVVATEMTFQNYASYSANGVLTQTNFHLDDSRPYTMVYMQCAPTAGTSPSTTIVPGLEFLIHYDAALEYITDTQLVEVHPATGRTVDYMSAMDILRGAPVFFENPLHLAGLAHIASHVGKYLGAQALGSIGSFVREKLKGHAKGTVWEPLF